MYVSNVPDDLGYTAEHEYVARTADQKRLTWISNDQQRLQIP